MAVYTIEPERRTLHGTFSRDYEPVLTIAPGDTVIYRTLDASWSLEGPILTSPKFEPRNPERDGGHALCGPIAIQGAAPGMTLQVKIDAIRVGTWGWTVAGGWDCDVNRRLGMADQPAYRLDWTLDPDSLTGRDQFGREIALRPFMGVMGMPPDEPGIHSTAPPRVTGGNLDCKELVAGTTLYLPIAVPGGLFSVGDGHAVQGDGEVSVTAIECPMERVELTFDLLPDLKLKTPRAETAGGWITLGVDADLNEAAFIALEAMLDLIEEKHGLKRQDALALASLMIDLRITQIVNGVRGVHAVLPNSALRTLKPSTGH
jgi:acetamidase/formamidase